MPRPAPRINYTSTNTNSQQTNKYSLSAIKIFSRHQKTIGVYCVVLCVLCGDHTVVPLLHFFSASFSFQADVSAFAIFPFDPPIHLCEGNFFYNHPHVPQFPSFTDHNMTKGLRGEVVGGGGCDVLRC